jgi:predicted NBD/HSP70 family sugar kinase
MYDLPDSARAVLRSLAANGPATRPNLGTALALSKPTMSAAIAELSRLELVTEQGSAKGATGRSAVLYSVANTAGHVLGVEIGATRVRVFAHTLDARQIGTRSAPRGSDEPTNVTPAAVKLAGELVQAVRDEVGEGYGPLRDVVVAAATVAGQKSGFLLDGLDADGFDTVLAALDLGDDVAVAVENNVNCSAIAEHRIGVARNQQMYAYVQVGVKIGLGVLIDGGLLRGAHGAAGEVAMLPFPWAGAQKPRRNALEHYLGSAALMERCAAAWPSDGSPVPADAEALFAAAAAGDATAQRFVDQHAQDIGRLVVGVMSVLDPGLVVLGGGVGQNPLVLTEIRRTVRELAWDTEVTTGALGERATVLGAVHLAISRTLDRIA